MGLCESPKSWVFWRDLLSPCEGAARRFGVSDRWARLCCESYEQSSYTSLCVAAPGELNGSKGLYSLAGLDCIEWQN